MQLLKPTRFARAPARGRRQKGGETCMSTPVIVYIHPDDQSERQQKAILGHCAEHDLEILGSVATPEAAAQAVGGGISSVVIAATDPRNGLRSQVVAAGGEVRFV